MNRSAIGLLLLLGLFCNSLLAGTILKWVDERGVVHYSDSAPAHVPSKSVSVNSAPSDPGPALPRLTTGNNESNNPNAGKEPDPETVPDDQAQAACEQAQSDLRTINNSDRIKLRAADGSIRFMSTDEINARKEQARQDIENYCR